MGNMFKPSLRPIDTSLGCLITLKEAQGVPMPQAKQGSNFRDEDILKRAVRFAIQSRPKSDGGFKGRYEVVHNAIQVPAGVLKNNPADWTFEKPEEKLLSNVLFRTTPIDKLDKEDSGARMIIELVVYVKSGKGKD